MLRENKIREDLDPGIPAALSFLWMVTALPSPPRRVSQETPEFPSPDTVTPSAPQVFRAHRVRPQALWGHRLDVEAAPSPCSPCLTPASDGRMVATPVLIYLGLAIVTSCASFGWQYRHSQQTFRLADAGIATYDEAPRAPPLPHAYGHLHSARRFTLTVLCGVRCRRSMPRLTRIRLLPLV